MINMRTKRRYKLLKSKRAVIFNIFIVIMTIMGLVYGFIMIQDKTDIDEKIGVSQFEMLMTYQDGDKAMMFIDNAGEISLRNAAFRLQEEGGVDAAKCGDYYGFNMWAPDPEGCMPDLIDLYDRLKVLMSAEMDTKVANYPNMTFLRYFVGPPTAATAAPTTGAISSGIPGGAEVTADGVVGGLNPIIEDNKVICADYVKKSNRCKLVPEAAAAVENIKPYIPDGQHIVIVSAVRSFSAQQNAFLNKYIKNGAPPACGPHKYRKLIYSAIGEPPKQGDEEYHKKVDQYLKDNKVVMDEIKNIKNYEGCPHIIAKAIDISLRDSQGTKISDDELRVIMCKADWVNYGVEDWHYEYNTKYWQKNRPDKISDELIGNPKNGNYHNDCYYSRLVRDEDKQ